MLVTEGGRTGQWPHCQRECADNEDVTLVVNYLDRRYLDFKANVPPDQITAGSDIGVASGCLLQDT